MPLWSHRGLTPDESYFSTEADGIKSHRARLMVNQDLTCETCEADSPNDTGVISPAADQAGDR